MTELSNTSAQTNFQKLGKSMKNYAISFWILAGTGFIFFIIMFSMPFYLLYEPQWDYPSESVFLGLIALLIFIGFLIYNFVRYIQFLSSLNEAANTSQDINLKKTYSLELWSFILSILLIFVVIIAIINFVNIVIENPDFEYYFYSGKFMFSMVMLVLLIIVCGLLIVILHIVAMFSFGQWAESLRGQSYQNMFINNIIDGSNLMKWGRLGAVFIGTIGTILFYVGMMKVGKNMMIYFGDDYKPENTNFNLGYSYQQPQVYNNQSFANPNQRYPNPNQQTHFNANQTSNILYCSRCGTKQKNLNPKFCSQCGNQLP